MIFDIQHNGKAKSHLLDDESGKPLCNTKGSLDFSDTRKLRIVDGKKFEVNRSPASHFDAPLTYDVEICNVLIDEYCKVCLKKAIKLESIK